MSKEEKKPNRIDQEDPKWEPQVQDDGSIKLLLMYPQKYADEEVVELHLKRPKGKHIKRIGRDVDMETLFKVASKITGYPPSFWDELDGADCGRVTEVVGDFLDSGAKTGRTN